MTDTSNVMSTQDTLLAFSEWLDGENICHAKEHDDLTPGDDVTHDDLARQFIEHWESNPQRATLAGRFSAQIGAALRKMAESVAKAIEDLPDHQAPVERS